jgi:CspA family cold shock protein
MAHCQKTQASQFTHGDPSHSVNVTKAYSFIQPDSGASDVFVHVSALQDGNDLREGDRVQFDAVESPRGGKLEARNVRVID